MTNEKGTGIEATIWWSAILLVLLFVEVVIVIQLKGYRIHNGIIIPRVEWFSLKDLLCL